ncbi:Imm6 family immunity protein [Variovorax sp. VaC1]|uniref:Imm6 family immunity protein n=1 Tax=Variovorax sp. VaC1 TaxID=3373132 RepID=UPI00374897C2
MNYNLSLRGSTALGLSIAELFLDGANLSDEDYALSMRGIELSWKWVEGYEVDPYQICQYIDGEINLPFRSTLYEPETVASHAMAVAFLSIGLAALNACNEVNKPPSESIDNFGENEWSVLIDLSQSLPEKKRESIEKIKTYLISLTRRDQGNFGAPIKKADVDGHQ